MAVSEDIAWFKKNFAGKILPHLAGTPISFDLVCAIAVQETGELWRKTRHTHPVEEVIRLAVGDSIGEPKRGAFPRTSAELRKKPRGDEMFALARKLLGEMAVATGIPDYKKAAANPDKFCHGYGIFQNDLQHFATDPDYFLEQRWTDVDAMVGKLMGELRRALASLKLTNKTSLTDLESAFVAIVYNTGFGNFKASKGLKQGHRVGNTFYGENIDTFLKVARSVPTPGGASTPTPAPAPAVTPAASPIILAPLPVAPRRSAVAVAKTEFDRFHGINEGSQPLRGRIADYYEAGNGSRTLDPTDPDNAWSAAFISFCIKQGGATPAQFKFNLSHSVFVKAAIANASANTGVFRGHPIDAHAVEIGDLVHHNRDGGKKTFAFARDNTGYPSHSAIVVDFEMRDGIRHAITIGGNEAIPGGTGTVGKKAFALDARGMLDQSRITPRLICVVENLLEQVPVALPPHAGRFVVRVSPSSVLFIRGGAGSGFEKIKRFEKGFKAGTVLNVLGFQDTPSGPWALVDVEGDGTRDGFVSAAFLDPVPA